jgi:hypothetical protein
MGTSAAGRRPRWPVRFAGTAVRVAASHNWSEWTRRYQVLFWVAGTAVVVGVVLSLTRYLDAVDGNGCLSTDPDTPFLSTAQWIFAVPAAVLVVVAPIALWRWAVRWGRQRRVPLRQRLRGTATAGIGATLLAAVLVVVGSRSDMPGCPPGLTAAGSGGLAVAASIGVLLLGLGLARKTDSSWIAFALVACVDVVLICLLLVVKLDADQPFDDQLGLAFVVLTIHLCCITASLGWALKVASDPAAGSVERAKSAEAGRGAISVAIALAIASLMVLSGFLPSYDFLSGVQGPALAALSLGALAVVGAGGFTKYVEAREQTRRNRRQARWRLTRQQHRILTTAVRMTAAVGPCTPAELAVGAGRALSTSSYHVRVTPAQVRRVLVARSGLPGSRTVRELPDGRWSSDAAPWPTDERLLALARAAGPPPLDGRTVARLVAAAHGGRRPTISVVHRHPLLRRTTPRLPTPAGVLWWLGFGHASARIWTVLQPDGPLTDRRAVAAGGVPPGS